MCSGRYVRVISFGALKVSTVKPAMRDHCNDTPTSPDSPILQ